MGGLVHTVAAWLLDKVVGSFVRSPLAVGNDGPDLEPLDEEGIESVRHIEGVIAKELFREFVAELDGALERSFREAQRNFLMSKISNLSNRESTSSMFTLAHRGKATSLQLQAQGDGELLYVSMEGSGPVMDLVKEKFSTKLGNFLEMAEFRECRVATEDYDQLLDLRFYTLRMPLGLRWSAEDLQWEQLERHFGIFVLGSAVASVVVRDLPGGGVRLRQIAVLERLRGRGFGRSVMEQVEATLAHEGVREFELHSREDVARFYENLGYQREGQIFVERGLPHIKMRKVMLNG